MQSEKCNSERGLNQEVLILVLASMKNFENPLKPRHIFELSRLTGRSVSQIRNACHDRGVHGLIEGGQASSFGMVG
jgi:hypothetical protein